VFGEGRDVIRRGFDVALSMATGTWAAVVDKMTKRSA
jgi:hypothetical protein